MRISGWLISILWEWTGERLYNSIVTKQEDLTAYLFDGELSNPFDGRLSRDMLRWMNESSRFTTFVETYRDKIRKKIRVTRDLESLFDIKSELTVAFALLNDRHLSITYEPFASERRRGPDFTVTYRSNVIFNIEVARLRLENTPVNEPVLARKGDRIVRILLDKLSQMQPGMSNLLVIQTDEQLMPTIDIVELMQLVKTRAESRDDSFYLHSRYTDPSSFYKDFLRLNGIILWAISSRMWVNKQARPVLPEKTMRLVRSLLLTPETG
jgi:hypothetical protein